MRFRLLRWAVLALLATMTAMVVPVAAQSNGLGITPKLSYTIAAGSQRTDTLYVNNLSTSQPLNLKLSVVDFRPEGETGSPKLLKASNEPLTPWSLKPYISLPQFVTIDPGKSKLIPFTIKFPPNIGAGSYYSAVEYNALNAPNEERVIVGAAADTLVFVNVPGNATEQLSLIKFGASSLKVNKNQDGSASYSADTSAPFKNLFTNPNIAFGYRIKDSGNLSEAPSGSIAVKNMFGHIVASIDSANPRSELVLIGQTRKFAVCYPKSTKSQDLGQQTNCRPLNISPGRYTAEVEFLYGQNGQASRQISGKATFWYLPLWFVVVAILVLLALGYLIYWLYKKITAPKHRHHKR